MLSLAHQFLAAVFKFFCCTSLFLFLSPLPSLFSLSPLSFFLSFFLSLLQHITMSTLHLKRERVVEPGAKKSSPPNKKAVEESGEEGQDTATSLDAPLLHKGSALGEDLPVTPVKAIIARSSPSRVCVHTRDEWIKGEQRILLLVMCFNE